MPETPPGGGPGTEILNLAADFAPVPTAAWESRDSEGPEGCRLRKATSLAHRRGHWGAPLLSQR